MALQGPNELEPVFQELEAELGDTIPAVVVESQRRLTRSGLYPEEMLGDIDKSRAQLALRGLGSLKDLEVDRQGLRMRLNNTTLHLIIVGMMQGLFEPAYDTDTEVDFEFTEESDLELEIKPKG
jgi:hypothetical protein